MLFVIDNMISFVNHHFYFFVSIFFVSVEIAKRLRRYFFLKCDLYTSIIEPYTTFTSTSMTISTIYYLLILSGKKVDNFFVCILLLAFVVSLFHWTVLNGLNDFAEIGIFAKFSGLTFHLLNLIIPMYEFFIIRNRNIKINKMSLIYASIILILYGMSAHLRVTLKYSQDYPYFAKQKSFVFFGCICLITCFGVWTILRFVM